MSNSAKLTEPKILTSKPLDNADAKWITLKKLTYLDQAGKERPWESCERRTRKGEVDAVIIFPILRSGQSVKSLHAHGDNGEDDRETVLILQFRPAVGKIVVELPAGLVDAGESAEVAARRELREETGYVAKGVLMTSPVVFADPGITNANARLVFLEVDKDDEQNVNPVASMDDGEFIETVLVKIRDLVTKLEEYDAKGYAVDSRLMSFALGASLV